MNNDHTLVGATIAILAITGLLAALVPTAISSPDDAVEEDEDGDLAIQEVRIAPDDTSNGTATLTVNTRLAHRGPATENVTVLLRAVDTESGVIETRRELDVGAVSGDRETAVAGNITVPRDGDYRLETVVYADERRIAEGYTDVAGIRSFHPVTFESFDGTDMASLPSIEYSVTDVDENRSTLDVTAYVTNTDTEPAEAIDVVLVARQVESNIVADRARVSVGSIDPSRTAMPNASLTVPDGYNYYLDAMIFRDGVLITSTRAPASLAPGQNFSAPVNQSGDDLDVSEFEETEQTETATAQEQRDAAGDGDGDADAGGQPGFGPVVAAVGVLCALLLRWRS